jgi:hypothetical protein
MNDQDAIVSEGRAALERIEEHGRKLFADYVLVGDALVVGRSECLKLSGGNSIQSPVYRTHFRRWIDAQGFGSMDGGARDDAMWLAEHKTEVTRWRDGLSEAARRNCNHPTTCRTHFGRGTKPQPRGPKAKPHVAEQDHRRNAARELPERAEQDLIRFVGDAMRQSGKQDWYGLAAVSIEAQRRYEIGVRTSMPAKAAKPTQQLALELMAQAN